MTEDPGKTRATYRALLLLLVIYCGGYFFARINDWIVVKMVSSKIVFADGKTHYLVFASKLRPFTKPLVYFYKPLTFVEIEIRGRIQR